MASLTRLERAALAAITGATALAGVGRYAGWTPVLAFGLATLALAGLAWVVSFGTEQAGEHFGPSIAGLLQSTCGNLPELFVVIFALDAGEVTVAQTSIVGSILANSLLMLGLVFIVGSRRAHDGVMRFHPRTSNDTATLLLITTFIIVVVGLGFRSGTNTSHHIATVSAIAAGLLLTVYLAWVIPYVRSDEGAHATATPRLSFSVALGLLLVAGTGSAFASNWFVHALAPAIHTLHISRVFAGLVIVAVAGNAVENTAGVIMAAKRRYDLAVSIVMNSVAQIAAFLFPALVLVSLASTKRLTFSLSPLLTGALALTVIAVRQIARDGEAAAWEGWALVATYVTLAAITLYE